MISRSLPIPAACSAASRRRRTGTSRPRPLPRRSPPLRSRPACTACIRSAALRCRQYRVQARVAEPVDVVEVGRAARTANRSVSAGTSPPRRIPSSASRSSTWSSRRRSSAPETGASPVAGCGPSSMTSAPSLAACGVRDRGRRVQVAATVGERVLGDVDDPDDAGVSRRSSAPRGAVPRSAAHARAPADGIRCSPRRTATRASARQAAPRWCSTPTPVTPVTTIRRSPARRHGPPFSFLSPLPFPRFILAVDRAAA